MKRSSTCTIVSYEDFNGSFPPTIANFDSGHLPKNDAKKVVCDVLRDGDTNNRSLLVTRQSQVYKGELSTALDSICNTLILVRNRKTGKGRLLSSSTCNLRNFTNAKQPANTTLNVSTEDPDSFSKSMNRLAEHFGSKKSKRASEIGQRMRATTSCSTAKMEETIAGICNPIETIAKIDNTEDDLIKRLLPPCDRNAVDVADVYQLKDLLSQRELDELRTVAEMIISQAPNEKSIGSDFLVNPFFKSLGPNITVLQAQLLVYANSLLSFTRLLQSDLKSKNPVQKICPHSKQVGINILKNFTVISDRGRSRTPNLTDKAVCYAMVAILLACDFKIQLEWFSTCLKGYRQKQLTMLTRVVGLVPTSGFKTASAKTFVLKLPLPALPTGKPLKKKS